MDNDQGEKFWKSEDEQLKREKALLKKPVVYAWDRAITLDLPATILRGERVEGTTRVVRIRDAIDAMRAGATNARDRIVAAGLLAIIEELEKPQPTWRDS